MRRGSPTEQLVPGKGLYCNRIQWEPSCVYTVVPSHEFDRDNYIKGLGRCPGLQRGGPAEPSKLSRCLRALVHSLNVIHTYDYVQR